MENQETIEKKSMFKEVIIALLLCLLIMLIFAIVLYKYVPSNSKKALPAQISYATPKDVSQELISSSADEDEVIMTYEVQPSDMTNYERIKDYNPGKANPFQELPDPDEEASSSTTNSGTTNNGSTSSAGSSSTGNSGSSSGTSTESSSSTSGESNNGGGTTSSSSEFYNDHGSGK